ncbi:uncharacterized protein [Henckelia pumila]|uniref:uncharacterized protein n=1 Tax=Henckelia pumila TaxID=405737 RepID=UPI003C6E6E07
MASGNSGGSIHESSSSGDGGGDEEYDSRATESISNSFLNKNPPINFASLITSGPHPPFLPHQNQSSSYYNINSQNLDLYPPSTPTFQYHDHNIINISSDGMIWGAGSLRSEANSTTDALIRNQSQLANAARPASQPAAEVITKNSKKRTRASRRAPTTVLTTDTSNFRQMVQEFTGIPTAPFPGSPYPRRMNLLSPLRPATHLDGLGPLYSLRPQSQNIVSPFSSSSSIYNATMVDAIVSTTNIVSTGNKTSSTAAVLGDHMSSNINSPLLSDQGLLNLQHHHSSSLHPPSLHGHRFEPINFGNYLGDFRNQEINIASGDLKINDDNNRVWRSGDQSVKNDDGIQEKFMPFGGKI